MRLDKFLSDNTSVSRSEIKKYIKNGSVKVNDNIILNFDYKIDAEADNIEFIGKTVIYKPFVYILLNKPRGVLSASNDKTQKTVVDLAPENLKFYDLFPVGRLDKDTTGLILLTNDGEFAHSVISPKSMVEKSYIAEVDGVVPNDICDKFTGGITLADGYVCAPAKAEKISENSVRIILTEGKYHQIKRMLGTVNLGVNKLHRERIGSLVLPDDLETGKSAEIDKERAFAVFTPFSGNYCL